MQSTLDLIFATPATHITSHANFAMRQKDFINHCASIIVVTVLLEIAEFRHAMRDA